MKKSRNHNPKCKNRPPNNNKHPNRTEIVIITIGVTTTIENIITTITIITITRLGHIITTIIVITIATTIETEMRIITNMKIDIPTVVRIIINMTITKSRTQIQNNMARKQQIEKIVTPV